MSIDHGFVLTVLGQMRHGTVAQSIVDSDGADTTPTTATGDNRDIETVSIARRVIIPDSYTNRMVTLIP